MKKLAVMFLLASIFMMVPAVHAGHFGFSDGGAGGGCDEDDIECQQIYIDMLEYNPNLTEEQCARFEEHGSIYHPILPWIDGEIDTTDIDQFEVILYCDFDLFSNTDDLPGAGRSEDHHQGRSESAQEEGNNGVSEMAPGHTRDQGASDLAPGRSANAPGQQTDSHDSDSSSNNPGQGHGSQDNPGQGNGRNN